MVIAPLFVGSAHVVNVFGKQRPSPPSLSRYRRVRVTRRTSQLPAKDGDPPQLSFLGGEEGCFSPRSNSTPREKLDPRIPLPRIIIAPRANEQVGVTRGGGTGYRSREAQPPSFLREGGNFRDEKGGRAGDGGGWRIEDYCANRFRRFRLLEGSR